MGCWLFLVGSYALVMFFGLIFQLDLCLICFQDLHGLQNSDNIMTRGAKESSKDKGRSCYWSNGASQLINLFGGVEVFRINSPLFLL